MLPDFPRRTVAVLTTLDPAPHAIPVSAPVEDVLRWRGPPHRARALQRPPAFCILADTAPLSVHEPEAKRSVIGGV